eukprot:TRINITY_DN11536_c1_g1_i1.p1 TRINITY_DN11536_c1_g1~~TRINITY_DN11536_c1_g1_i1.p1  ORF type:complete len:261 (+),score=35.84 TRINITY_DN11536_c1_g1_i1:459-1241(+)
MMLMTVLKRHYGTDGKDVLHLFRDLPSCPFSIQNIALKGGAYGKTPGQWFAPTTIARVLHDLVQIQFSSSPDPITVVVAEDRTVPSQDILRAAGSGGVLLLIPSMLGMEPPIADPYKTFLYSHLTCQHSVGILGGKPRHALYLIGHKADHVIVLDPHRVQPAFVDADSMGSMEQPRKLSVHISELDTCCLLSYYARGVDDAQALLDFLSARPANMSYSYFSVVPNDAQAGALSTLSASSSSVSLSSEPRHKKKKKKRSSA